MVDELLKRAKALREAKQEVRVRLKEIELQHVKENKKIRESTTEEDDLKQVQKWLEEEASKSLTSSGAWIYADGSTVTTLSSSGGQ